MFQVQGFEIRNAALSNKNKKGMFILIASKGMIVSSTCASSCPLMLPSLILVLLVAKFIVH